MLSDNSTLPSNCVTYASWKDSLRALMADPVSPSSAPPQQHFWVLDASANPDLPKYFWELEENPDAWALYMNTYLEDARDAGPWFLPCKADSALTEWVFSQLEFTPLGFMVSVSQGSGNLLFEHFQRLVECKLPSGKPGLYRYYDPRILYGVNTFDDKRVPGLVRGPALAMHAWEPGRAVPISMERKTPDFLVCTEAPELSQELVEHLGRESQGHTIINTLGGIAGQRLRMQPLPEAHSYVESMRNFLKPSPYQSNTDVAFATAYSILALDDTWEDVVEEVVCTKFRDCTSLEEALGKAYPVWNAQRGML